MAESGNSVWRSYMIDGFPLLNARTPCLSSSPVKQHDARKCVQAASGSAPAVPFPLRYPTKRVCATKNGSRVQRGTHAHNNESISVDAVKESKRPFGRRSCSLKSKTKAYISIRSGNTVSNGFEAKKWERIRGHEASRESEANGGKRAAVGYGQTDGCFRC